MVDRNGSAHNAPLLRTENPVPLAFTPTNSSTAEVKANYISPAHLSLSLSLSVLPLFCLLVLFAPFSFSLHAANTGQRMFFQVFSAVFVN